MPVDMVSLGNGNISSFAGTNFSTIPSDGAPAVVVYGYTRAMKTSDKSFTTWRSSTIPDLLMVDHPDRPDPGDYEDFVVLR
jgi:hypothetical protein